jgi:hypothetical protein
VTGGQVWGEEERTDLGRIAEMERDSRTDKQKPQADPERPKADVAQGRKHLAATRTDLEKPDESYGSAPYREVRHDHPSAVRSRSAILSMYTARLTSRFDLDVSCPSRRNPGNHRWIPCRGQRVFHTRCLHCDVPSGPFSTGLDFIRNRLLEPIAGCAAQVCGRWRYLPARLAVYQVRQMQRDTIICF